MSQLTGRQTKTALASFTKLRKLCWRGSTEKTNPRYLKRATVAVDTLYSKLTYRGWLKVTQDVQNEIQTEENFHSHDNFVIAYKLPFMVAVSHRV